MKNVRIVASSSPAVLASANPHVTVEAEYGDAVVQGSALTMAHHGPRAGGKCPCAYTVEEVRASFIGTIVDYYGEEQAVDNTPSEVVVGCSHFDLDTLGGCWAVLGYKYDTSPLAMAFWALAEFVDVNGPHRLAEGRARAVALYGEAAADGAMTAIHAFWAWSQANRGPRVTAELVDLTAHVKAAVDVLEHLLSTAHAGMFTDGSVDQVVQEARDTFRGRLEDAGRAFAAAEDALHASSLYATSGPVALRVADSFVNHLYLPVQGAAVVGFNPKFGSVTVSFADGAASPVSAVEIVQNLWGPLAGGHRGIAGSPRDRVMTREDAHAAFVTVCNALAPAGCEYHGRDLEAQCSDCARAVAS